MKVTATRATSKQDSCVDYHFYISNLSEAEIEDFGLFKCKIVAMRLATKEEFRQSGAIVVMLLGDPKPAMWDKEGEANGTRH